ncbi:MAG: hypothetical protein J3R72DRAFT_475262 [Linnemannia gamsii]|nr:MAG: hypothetical protein J3R72DRAFT_475262 [Linnemannia gamsii]
MNRSMRSKGPLLHNVNGVNRQRTKLPVMFKLKDLSVKSEDRTIKLRHQLIAEQMLRQDRVTSGSKDATARFWDGVNGTPSHILADHSGAITSIAFSPDSVLIATGSENKTMWLWDVTLGHN